MNIKSKYLITGGRGFIGSQIVKKSGGLSYDIKSGFDILDATQLKKAISGMTGIKGVFHCAAKISVPESVAKPEEYRRINVLGTQSVIDAAGSVGVKIVFSSSAAVYGEANLAVAETAHPNPKSPYAENKLDGEHLLKNASQSLKSHAPVVPHIALRYFNVYGPGQSPQYAGVITAFITAALAGKDIVIYGDGSQVRDFVYVDDVARANILAMEYPNTSFEVFNIGSGIETSIADLANMIIGLVNSRNSETSGSKVIHMPPRPGDIVYSQADVSKARHILNWKAEISLEEGLQKTIDFYKNL